MRRLCALVLAAGVVLAAATAMAEEVAATAKKEEKVPWRGSLFIYENTFSAYSLSQSADLTYNPYYAQSLSFRPRYYPRDDLSLALRLDLEVELTTSDDTDRRHQAILSDMLFDVSYKPAFMKIPVVGIKVEPNVRFVFPTSIESQGRSMVMAIGPGFALRREIPLLKGKWLSSLELMYGFRASKYFHKYATAQVGSAGTCNNPGREECQFLISTNEHGMARNRNWRFSNSLELSLKILDKLSFTADALFYNDLIHGFPEETITLGGGTTETLPGSKINHKASTWFILDVTYDVLDWLSLSIGTSTFYSQLRPDSSYNVPFFNRYTNFYFDITIPVDRFISQVQTWAGKKKSSSSGEGSWQRRQN